MVVYSTETWKGVKNLALKSAKGNSEKTTNLTVQTQQFLHTKPVELILLSEASLERRGGTSHVGGGGRWTADESPVHINVLELHAAKLTLLALAPNVSH